MSAEGLLQQSCSHEEINACVELASLYQSRGQVRWATELTAKWCELSKGSLFGSAVPHACRLDALFRQGRVPRQLSDIFQSPIDGTEYTGLRR